MKKLLFGAAAIMLMVSCSGNGASEKAQEDSTRITDSIAQQEAALATDGQVRQDSLRQDSIAKAEAAAQYDDLLNEYLAATTKLENLAKKVKRLENVNFNTVNNTLSKCVSLERQIKKVKSKLTPEQLEKFKKGKTKWDKNVRNFVS